MFMGWLHERISKSRQQPLILHAGISNAMPAERTGRAADLLPIKG